MRLAPLALALAVLAAGEARAAPALQLERTLPLTGGAGRIDHLAFDAKRGRLVVAELGAGLVEAVDLASGKAAASVSGLKEPQGVAVLAERDEVAVASGGDGTVRFYRAADLSPVAEVMLGEDADNLRVDPRNGTLVAGYGSGALAVIDPTRHVVLRRIVLAAHPESFQLSGGRAYVNLPGANRLAVVDIDAGRVTGGWGNPGALANFPLALEPGGGPAVAYRAPARLALFGADGGVRQKTQTCGDSDDLFFDAGRKRIYVICGQGAVDTFGQGPGGYVLQDRMATVSGARTGLYVPQLDRLFVAARAQGRDRPRILVLKPLP